MRFEWRGGERKRRRCRRSRRSAAVVVCARGPPGPGIARHPRACGKLGDEAVALGARGVKHRPWPAPRVLPGRGLFPAPPDFAGAPAAAARPVHPTLSPSHLHPRHLHPHHLRHPPRPAAPHLCGQAAGGRPHAGGLQHPEGVHPAPCPPPAGRDHRALAPDPGAQVQPGQDDLPQVSSSLYWRERRGDGKDTRARWSENESERADRAPRSTATFDLDLQKHGAVLKFGLSLAFFSPGDEYPPHIEPTSHALPAVSAFDLAALCLAIQRWNKTNKQTKNSHHFHFSPPLSQVLRPPPPARDQLPQEEVRPHQPAAPQEEAQVIWGF